MERSEEPSAQKNQVLRRTTRSEVPGAQKNHALRRTERWRHMQQPLKIYFTGPAAVAAPYQQETRHIYSKRQTLVPQWCGDATPFAFHVATTCRYPRSRGYYVAIILYQLIRNKLGIATCIKCGESSSGSMTRCYQEGDRVRQLHAYACLLSWFTCKRC